MHTERENVIFFDLPAAPFAAVIAVAVDCADFVSNYLNERGRNII